MKPVTPDINQYFRTYYIKNGGVNNPCPCNPPALPLSKTKNINTSTNNTAISSRMRCAQIINAFGTQQSSTSYAQKTCRIGGPTFSY